MPPKIQKSKEAKAKAAMSSSKGKKKKWGKGKVRDKLVNLALFDKATFDKFNKEVPGYKVVFLKSRIFGEYGHYKSYLAGLNDEILGDFWPKHAIIGNFGSKKKMLIFFQPFSVIFSHFSNIFSNPTCTKSSLRVSRARG